MRESARPAEPAPRTAGASSSRQVALFDLDHTLTRRDTFLDFCLRTGRGRCLQALPRLVAACFAPDSVARNTVLKRELIRALFLGWREEDFAEAGRSYASDRLPTLLRAEALARLSWHQRQGHRVIVVSASLTHWIAPWCADMQLEMIATGLQVEGGKLTGEFDPPNCHGPEKARRVRALLGDSDERQLIHAYGDSEGDRQMLALADFPYFRSFERPTPFPRRPFAARSRRSIS